MDHRWHIHPDPEQCAAACARHISSAIADALARADFATLAVSGGSTPKLLFRQMRLLEVEWERVHLFFVDERAVPPDSDQSNFRLAKEHLIEPLAIPERNVCRIHSEMPPQAAAERYEAEIRKVFALKAGELPRFDVVQLGMGDDAHTASLFPGEPLIQDRNRIAAAVNVEKKQQWRITLLPGVLLAARERVFLVTGADKSEAVRRVFQGEYDPQSIPAQLAGRENAIWFMDEAAGGAVRQ